SRGLAILGDTLYMGTIDAHMVAIDAKTGKILWDHTVEKVGEKPIEKYAITHAPVVIKDKIIVGIAGGDLGVRGFICALDANTGKLKWFYQFTPHDEVDYDSTQVPVLADIQWQGRPRKVMLWANRNGLAYVIDRTTGEFLLGKPFVKVNWMDGFDQKG